MLKKLRFRFVLVNMIFVTLLLILMFTMILHFTKENMVAENNRLLYSLADLPISPNPLFDSDRPRSEDELPVDDLPMDELPEKADDPVHLPYFILRQSPNGDVFTDGSFQTGDLEDADYVSALMERVLGSSAHTGVLQDYELQFLLLRDPQGIKVIFADIASQQSSLHSLCRTCALIGGFSFLFFLGVSLLLSRIMVKPVELAWQQQRRFVADASHELKTPLTVILTNAQLLQGESYDPDSRRRFSDSILTMSDHMRSLVERLLELARADNGDWREPMLDFDLSRMVSDALLPFEPLLFETGLQFDASIHPGIHVRGSEGRLREVLEILLDNARKYAAADGAVRVSLEMQGRGRCRLRVSNTGEPIPPEQRKELFKRFYRADSARSRDGGFGLGLSIALEIVTLHRGRISVDCSDGWNRFTVELPTL